MDIYTPRSNRALFRLRRSYGSSSQAMPTCPIQPQFFRPRCDGSAASASAHACKKPPATTWLQHAGRTYGYPVALPVPAPAPQLPHHCRDVRIPPQPAAALAPSPPPQGTMQANNKGAPSPTTCAGLETHLATPATTMPNAAGDGTWFRNSRGQSTALGLHLQVNLRTEQGVRMPQGACPGAVAPERCCSSCPEPPTSHRFEWPDLTG